MVKADVAVMIRKLRLALGLTQEQFAARLGSGSLSPLSTGGRIAEVIRHHWP